MVHLLSPYIFNGTNANVFAVISFDNLDNWNVNNIKCLVMTKLESIGYKINQWIFLKYVILMF